ncbi:conserved Plasmodium protein, unknown function [Plasmodium berghei]|uniref:Uncharacterized protein n=1 Tax=Plasmodium berghei TaxID=5821 RepID=A0A1D3S9B3_PLABE|nr:conserved Plasmodium protein, unknown function [Plasmodium berghei]
MDKNYEFQYYQNLMKKELKDYEAHSDVSCKIGYSDSESEGVASIKEMPYYAYKKNVINNKKEKLEKPIWKSFYDIEETAKDSYSDYEYSKNKKVESEIESPRFGNTSEDDYKNSERVNNESYKQNENNEWENNYIDAINDSAKIYPFDKINNNVKNSLINNRNDNSSNEDFIYMSNNLNYNFKEELEKNMFNNLNMFKNLKKNNFDDATKHFMKPKTFKDINGLYYDTNEKAIDIDLLKMEHEKLTRMSSLTNLNRIECDYLAHNNFPNTSNDNEYKKSKINKSGNNNYTKLRKNILDKNIRSDEINNTPLSSDDINSYIYNRNVKDYNIDLKNKEIENIRKIGNKSKGKNTILKKIGVYWENKKEMQNEESYEDEEDEEDDEDEEDEEDDEDEEDEEDDEDEEEEEEEEVEEDESKKKHTYKSGKKRNDSDRFLKLKKKDNMPNDVVNNKNNTKNKSRDDNNAKKRQNIKKNIKSFAGTPKGVSKEIVKNIIKSIVENYDNNYSEDFNSNKLTINVENEDSENNQKMNKSILEPQNISENEDLINEHIAKKINFEWWKSTEKIDNKEIDGIKKQKGTSDKINNKDNLIEKENSNKEKIGNRYEIPKNISYYVNMNRKKNAEKVIGNNNNFGKNNNSEDDNDECGSNEKIDSCENDNNVDDSKAEENFKSQNIMKQLNIEYNNNNSSSLSNTNKESIRNALYCEREQISNYDNNKNKLLENEKSFENDKYSGNTINDLYFFYDKINEHFEKENDDDLNNKNKSNLISNDSDDIKKKNLIEYAQKNVKEQSIIDRIHKNFNDYDKNDRKNEKIDIFLKYLKCVDKNLLESVFAFFVEKESNIEIKKHLETILLEKRNKVNQLTETTNILMNNQNTQTVNKDLKHEGIQTNNIKKEDNSIQTGIKDINNQIYVRENMVNKKTSIDSIFFRNLTKDSGLLEEANAASKSKKYEYGENKNINISANLNKDEYEELKNIIDLKANILEKIKSCYNNMDTENNYEEAILMINDKGEHQKNINIIERNYRDDNNSHQVNKTKKNNKDISNNLYNSKSIGDNYVQNKSVITTETFETIKSFEDKIKILKLQNERLKKKIEKLYDEKEKIKNDYKKMEKIKKNQDNLFEATDKHIEKLHCELENMSKQNELIKINLKDKDMKIIELESQICNNNMYSNECLNHTNLDVKNRESNTKEHANNNDAHSLNDSITDKKQIKKQIVLLQDQLFMLKNEIKQMEFLKSKNMELNKLLNMKKCNINENERNIDKLEKSIDKLKEKNFNLTEQICDLKEKIIMLEKAAQLRNDESSNTTASSIDSGTTINNEIKIMKEEIEALYKDKIKLLKSNLEEKTNKINILNTLLKTSNEQSIELNKKIKCLLKENKNLQKNYEKSINDLKKINIKYEDILKENSIKPDSIITTFDLNNEKIEHNTVKQTDEFAQIDDSYDMNKFKKVYDIPNHKDNRENCYDQIKTEIDKNLYEKKCTPNLKETQTDDTNLVLISVDKKEMAEIKKNDYNILEDNNSKINGKNTMFNNRKENIYTNLLKNENKYVNVNNIFEIDSIRENLQNMFSNTNENEPFNNYGINNNVHRYTNMNKINGYSDSHLSNNIESEHVSIQNTESLQNINKYVNKIYAPIEDVYNRNNLQFISLHKNDENNRYTISENGTISQNSVEKNDNSNKYYISNKENIIENNQENSIKNSDNVNIKTYECLNKINEFESANNESTLNNTETENNSTNDFKNIIYEDNHIAYNNKIIENYNDQDLKNYYLNSQKTNNMNEYKPNDNMANEKKKKGEAWIIDIKNNEVFPYTKIEKCVLYDEKESGTKKNNNKKKGCQKKYSKNSTVNDMRNRTYNIVKRPNESIKMNKTAFANKKKNANLYMHKTNGKKLDSLVNDISKLVKNKIKEELKGKNVSKDITNFEITKIKKKNPISKSALNNIRQDTAIISSDTFSLSSEVLNSTFEKVDENNKDNIVDKKGCNSDKNCNDQINNGTFENSFNHKTAYSVNFTTDENKQNAYVSNNDIIDTNLQKNYMNDFIMDNKNNYSLYNPSYVNNDILLNNLTLNQKYMNEPEYFNKNLMDIQQLLPDMLFNDVNDLYYNMNLNKNGLDSSKMCKIDISANNNINYDNLNYQNWPKINLLNQNNFNSNTEIINEYIKNTNPMVNGFMQNNMNAFNGISNGNRHSDNYILDNNINDPEKDSTNYSINIMNNYNDIIKNINGCPLPGTLDNSIINPLLSCNNNSENIKMSFENGKFNSYIPSFNALNLENNTTLYLQNNNKCLNHDTTNTSEVNKNIQAELVNKINNSHVSDKALNNQVENANNKDVRDSAAEKNVYNSHTNKFHNPKNNKVVSTKNCHDKKNNLIKKSTNRSKSVDIKKNDKKGNLLNENNSKRPKIKTQIFNYTENKNGLRDMSSYAKKVLEDMKSLIPSNISSLNTTGKNNKIEKNCLSSEINNIITANESPNFCKENNDIELNNLHNKFSKTENENTVESKVPTYFDYDNKQNEKDDCADKYTSNNDMPTVHNVNDKKININNNMDNVYFDKKHSFQYNNENISKENRQNTYSKDSYNLMYNKFKRTSSAVNNSFSIPPKSDSNLFQSETRKSLSNFREALKKHGILG